MNGRNEKPPARPSPKGELDLRRLTAARVALGRSGAGVPTGAQQRFLLDHARAREAVWTEADFEPVEAALRNAGHDVVFVESRAPDRATYLRRPDLGRLLSARAAERLGSDRAVGDADIALVVADGLSATAVAINAAPLALRLGAAFEARGWRTAPIVLARQARVALGDGVGEALRARIAVVLVGERPGLSAADSLGAYVTFAPKPGTPDSRRNCVSNIREGGLGIESAARQIEDLVARMLAQGRSGVTLARDAPAAAIETVRLIQP